MPFENPDSPHRGSETPGRTPVDSHGEDSNRTPDPVCPRGSNGGELNELEWVAFQYLSDELDEPQRQRFEQQLGENLAAAEALSAMVSLIRQIQGLQAVEPCEFGDSPTPGPVAERLRGEKCRGENRRGENRRAGGRRLTRGQMRTRWQAAAAIVVALIGGGGWLLTAWQETGRRESSGLDSLAAGSGWEGSDQVAEAWAGQLDDENRRDAMWEADEYSNGENSNEETEGAVSEETAEDDDWLYAALVSLEDWPTEGQGGGS